MAATIDERVVEMRFDNKQFEAGAKETMGTLGKLKQALNFKDYGDTFNKIQKSADKVDVSGLNNAIDGVKLKFSALEIAAITALNNIVNRAVDAGIRIAKSLSIDQANAGFAEYELKMGSVQTIIASTGESLQTVNEYLEELNKYSDKTIYSFSDMTQNIGKFTNAGVKLEDAVKAIQGISNEAAVSGANANEASRAMYNFAQAISSGVVRLIDWKSIENANMATIEFKQQLLDTALAMGTVVKEGEQYQTVTTDLNGNVSDLFNATAAFNDSLAHQWITTDVLVQTLSNYSNDVREMTYAEREAYEEKLRGIGYTEDQIKAIEDLGVKAFNSAQDVKTLSQLMDTMKETVGSGWAQTFELIIGDFEEAKELWTNVNQTLGGIIEESSKSRNILLRHWKQGFGRDILIDAVSNSFNSLLSVIKAIGKAFRNVFPRMLGSQLVKLTKNFRDLTERLKPSEETLDKITRTFTGLFSILDIVGQAIGAFFKLIAPGIPIVGDLGDGILGVTAAIGDWITNLNKAIKENDWFTKAVERIREVVNNAITVIKDFAYRIGEMIKSLMGFEDVTLDDVINSISDAFENLLSKIKNFNFKTVEDAFINLKNKIQEFLNQPMNSNNFSAFIENIKEFGENLKEALTLDNILDKMKGVMDVFGKFFNWIKDTLSPVFEGFTGGNAIASAGGFAIIMSMIKIADSFGKIADSLTSIPDLLGSVKDTLVAYQEKLKAEALLKTAFAIAALAGALVILSFTDTDKVMSAAVALSMLGGVLMFGIAKIQEAINSGGPSINDSLAELASGLSKTMKDFGKAKLVKSIGRMVKDIALSVGILALSIIGLGLMYKKNKESLFAGLEMLKIIGEMLMGMVILSGVVALLAGGKQISSVGTTMLMISLALGITIFAISKLFKMDLPNQSEIDKRMEILGAIAAGLIGVVIVYGLASKIAGGNQLNKISNVIKSMAILLLATVVSLSILFKMELPADYGAKLDILAGIFIAFASLIVVMGIAARISGGGGFKAASSILAIAVLLGTVVTSLFVLTLIPIDKMLTGALGLSMIMVALGVALAGAGAIVHDDVHKSIIAMATVIGAITVALAVLAAIPVAQLAKSVAALGVILLTLTLDFLAVSKITNKDAAIAVFGMVAAVISIAFSLYALAQQPWDSILAASASLSLVLTAMSIAFLIISKAKPDMMAIAAFVLASASVGLIALSIYELSKQPWENLLGAATALSEVLLAMTVAMSVLTIVGTFAAGALAGILLLDLFVANMALVLVALGKLLGSEEAKNLISGGAEVLALIGKAIGDFVGSIVSGFLETVSESLPEIGENLSKFMDNMSGFIEGSNNMSSEALSNVKQLAGMILALAAADVILGIGELLGVKLTDVGIELSKFMISMQPFILQSRFVKKENMEACQSMAGMILALTAADIIAGIGRVLGLTGNLSDFGLQLESFGPSIAQFAEDVKDIDPESVKGAAAAAETMGNIAKNLPAQDGLAGWISGSKSLSVFGEELDKFGPSIVSFSSTVAGITKDSVQGAADAAEILGNVANNLPAQGGLSGWINGDKSLSTFGEQLAAFGPDIVQFASDVEGVTSASVDGVAAATDILSTLANGLPNTESLWNKLFGGGTMTLSKFGGELVTFGGKMKEFSDALVDVKFGRIEAAIEDFEKLINLSISVQNGSAESLTEFMREMSTIGTKSVDDFAQTFTDGEPKVINSVNHMFSETNKVVVASDLKMKTASNRAGRNVGLGIESGIEERRPSVLSTTDSLGVSINESVKTHLTSFEFKQSGEKAITAIDTGINLKKDVPVDSVANIGGRVVHAAKNSLTFDEFYNIGKNVIDGLSGGIISKAESAAEAAARVSRRAYSAAKEALLIESPSKKFFELGEYSTEGMVLGLLNNIKSVANAGTDVADEAIEPLKDAVNGMMSLVNSDEFDNLDPVIRPVFDLSNLPGAANQISSTFQGLDLSRSVNLAQNISSDFSKNRSSKDINGINNRKLEQKIDRLINGEGEPRTQTNNFYIQSTDPKQAAEEVGYIMQHKVERGRAAWAR